ncbi:MAG: hypothetical protein ACJAQ5_001340 [Flavobacteriales bacterium]
MDGRAGAGGSHEDSVPSSKFRTENSEHGIENIEFGTQNTEQRTQNMVNGIENIEFGTQNTKHKIRKTEHETLKGEL